ncbi:uncharacterized protein LOC127807901 [Diospyros lotus]|uniref:uncharacterized protein LOC127807901 n=1 Tax=Diospyros lotus TaxID=55363 RepID=UPI0022555DD1|nr:uncharacterized protein LOC127807901 [Diospyros lotus]
MEWIQSQLNTLSISNVKSSCGSHIYSRHNVEEKDLNCEEAAPASTGQIFDPRCSQTKGAPRKLCKKSPLETNTKKTKVGSSKASKGKAPKQNIVQDAQVVNEGFPQHAQYYTLTPLTYSQHLMATTHYQTSNPSHGVPMIGMGQPFMPMYLPYRQPDDNLPDF